MNKGIIEIELNEVWELINKPSRFFSTLYREVEKYPLGDLDFDEKAKKEILKKNIEISDIITTKQYENNI